MNELRKYIQQNEILILTIVLILNVAVVGGFGIIPYTNSLLAKYENLKVINATQNSMEEKLALINRSRTEIDLYDNEIQALDQTLPKDEDMESLVVLLINESSKTGHRMEMLTPTRFEQSSGYFSAQVEFVGSPNLLGDLLRNFESAPRLLEITNIKTSQNRSGENVVKIDFKIFMLNLEHSEETQL